MRTMANLVSDIVNLNEEDLDMLAQAIAWFTASTSDKGERLERMLNVHNREQAARMARLKETV